MSGPNYVLDKGFIVDAAATGVDFGLGVINDDTPGKEVRLPSAANQVIFGVAQETIDDAKIATGKAVVNVRMLGITRAVAGAAITVRAEVTVTTAGKFIPAATTGHRVVGIALSPAAADNDHFNMLLTPGGRLVP